ncbi:MAG TPA: COX15/CtaA family protein [Longimicrobiales bacterium]
MPVQTLDRSPATHVAAPDPVRRRLGLLAAVAAAYTYALIIFGGIVRITGSGLGCGDDWPLCNGRILPPWDLPTWIEWTHRLLAAGLIVPVALVTVYALRSAGAARRGRDGAQPPDAAVPARTASYAPRGGPERPVFLAVALLVVQVVLGAVTVKLDLPAGVTSLHFVNALLLAAAFVIAAVRAHPAPTAGTATGTARRAARAATAAAALGFVVVGFGALTANTGLVGAQTEPSAAAWACQGFPLCNGSVFPASGGGGLVHIHWTHRLLAFLLFFHTLGATIAAFRRGAPAVARRGAALALGLVVAQVGVAAALVLLHLPPAFRVLHLVTGVAVWLALVFWAASARRIAPATG